VESFAFINEQFYTWKVDRDRTDLLLSRGWRHFGEHFFRYNLGVFEKEIRRVYALRIDLARFRPTRSYRRVLSRNADLRSDIRPVVITPETEALFERHKTRFRTGVPESVYNFVSREPATVPCETLECAVTDRDRLVAVSFFDVGNYSISSIYGMFEPGLARRSLGILTMLREIEYALDAGKRYYYHGYVFEGPSFYDYKKRFPALEMYDWNGGWSEYDGR
jgi:arginine-tRNA-protein transferase